jgi:predicted MPP superfamily phosphohydrolase
VSHSAGVADGPSELRIAHLSDIQTAVIGSHERRAFREAMAMEPDLILLTGDYLQVLAGHENLDKAREDFRTLLRGLRGPRLGAYAVKGDTEGPDWPSLVAGTPVVPLTDESLRLPFPGSPSGFVSLLGLSPGLARGRNGKTLRRLVKQLPDGDIKVVFGHSPDFIMSLDENTVDLALAGHTHGGQIVLPFFGPPMTLSRLPRKMARGLHFWNGTPLHVSAGVGMERELAPQVRFLCRPEVCLLRVKV